MILDFINQVGAWAWWILGLALLALEIVVAGTFFLWFGVAAIVVGTISLIFDWAWQVQVVAFVVLALALVVIGRRYFARSKNAPPASGLNERGTNLIGSVYLLREPIVDGSGRIKVGDSTWRVTGPDTPSGTRVRIVSADGSVLRVAPEA